MVSCASGLGPKGASGVGGQGASSSVPWSERLGQGRRDGAKGVAGAGDKGGSGQGRAGQGRGTPVPRGAGRVRGHGCCMADVSTQLASVWCTHECTHMQAHTHYI